MSTNGTNGRNGGGDGSERSRDPGRTMNSGTEFPNAALRRPAEDTRPSVEDLVGADMPFEPLPPPENNRHWDRVKGRWVRDGVSIPPDPSMATLPPQPMDMPQPGTPPSQPGPSSPAPSSAANVATDDIDAPVPKWGLVIVALMFGVGLALGFLFTVAH